MAEVKYSIVFTNGITGLEWTGTDKKTTTIAYDNPKLKVDYSSIPWDIQNPDAHPERFIVQFAYRDYSGAQPRLKTRTLTCNHVYSGENWYSFGYKAEGKDALRIAINKNTGNVVVDVREELIVNDPEVQSFTFDELTVGASYTAEPFNVIEEHIGNGSVIVDPEAMRAGEFSYEVIADSDWEVESSDCQYKVAGVDYEVKAINYEANLYKIQTPQEADNNELKIYTVFKSLIPPGPVENLGRQAIVRFDNKMTVEVFYDTVNKTISISQIKEGD